MAGTTNTSRSRRDLVARFNSSEVSETEIKAQLQSAQRVQNAQRALHSRAFWQPKPTRNTIQSVDLRSSDSLSKPPFDPRPVSVNTLRDRENPLLERTYSFNSLSTSHRVEEAARLSQYRDSPVSACHTDRIPLDVHEPEPCPSLKVSRARKAERAVKRSLKKQGDNTIQTTATIRHDRVQPLVKDGSPPRRAISEPAIRGPKDIAAHLIRKLKTSRSAKLAHRPRSSSTLIPHLDDFESKADLQNYLNSTAPEAVAVPEPPAAIAELPGSVPLPAYSRYEPASTTSLTPGQHLTDASATTSLQRAASVPSSPCCDPAPKMMRCDHCQFGIKHEDLYLQCLVCNHGDRIICDDCDAAGYSCRHQLVRKRRNFLQEFDGVPAANFGHSPSQARLTERQHGPSALAPAQRINAVPIDSVHEAVAESDHEARSTKHDSRELVLERRERALAQREQEARLHEREALLRIREAEVEAKAKQAEDKSSSELVRSCMEMAVSLGAQFASISRSASNASTEPASPVLPRTHRSADPYFPQSDGVDASLQTDEGGLRSHGSTKRKADKQPSQRAQSTSSKRQSASRSGRSSDHEAYAGEGDGDGSTGTPKKPRRENEANTAETRLFACHYCKFDVSRYSDANNTEKQYRGCSSGYWPDISRLKQHLYRVHWQGANRCTTCWAQFKTDGEVAAHHSQTSCEAAQCPCPEKFGSDVYDELHKKRPKASAEEVWFIVWDTLFPGTVRPNSPFADAATDSSSRPDEQSMQTLAHLFEARLCSQLPSSPSISPELRAFVIDQLRASIDDLIVRVPVPSGAPPTPMEDESSGSSSHQRRPMQLTIPQSISPGTTIASQPSSAVSTISTSSSRWHSLPQHRRSFSRPLNFGGPPTVAQRPPIHLAAVPTIERAVKTHDHGFHAQTIYDPEHDVWDAEGGSWQAGDEVSLADANPFDFDFEQTTTPGHAPGEIPQPNFEPSMFVPVKFRSLQDPMHPNGIPIGTRLQSKLPSEMSVDSAYGSGKSVRSSGIPIMAKASWNVESEENAIEALTTHSVLYQYGQAAGAHATMADPFDISWRDFMNDD